MGRKRLEMKYIDKEKQRNTTFKSRWKGLKKKAYELATLCDVPVCVVVYQGPNSEPETFPSSQDEVRAVINRYAYASIPKDQHSPKKPESKPANPTWLPALDGFGIEELAGLSDFLDNKLHVVAEKIVRLRGNFGSYDDGNVMSTNTCTSVGGDAQIGGLNHGMQWPMSVWQTSLQAEQQLDGFSFDVGGDARIGRFGDGMKWPWQPSLAEQQSTPKVAGMDGAGCSFDQLEGDMSGDYAGGLQGVLFENVEFSGGCGMASQPLSSMFNSSERSEWYEQERFFI